MTDARKGRKVSGSGIEGSARAGLELKTRKHARPTQRNRSEDEENRSLFHNITRQDKSFIAPFDGFSSFHQPFTSLLAVNL